MQWNSDPKTKWVAIYRIIVLIILLTQAIVTARSHVVIQSEVQHLSTIAQGAH